MNKKQEVFTTNVDVGGHNLQFEVGRFAEQADAAVMGRYGDTLILVTVVSSLERQDLDYFPLFVEYQEKLYAGGRIKGSRWVKREGRPSDDAILNARLVDRSIRPLFPKAFSKETQVIITVLSVDAENDPDMVAINTASAALAISRIPWEGPVAAVRLGYIPKAKNNAGDTQEQPSGQTAIDQENDAGSASGQPHATNLTTKDGFFLVNPTYKDREYSDMDLMVASTREAVVMVEAGANEVAEETCLQALEVAAKESSRIIAAISELAKKVSKTKLSVEEKPTNPEVVRLVKKYLKDHLQMYENPDKSRAADVNFKEIAAAIVQTHQDRSLVEVEEVAFGLVKEAIRETITKKGKRPDGRKPEEIREISIETGMLPRTHGSAMFKRGMTQALTITTLAAPALEQWIETMEGEGTKRYMHHYYMPPYSVGEVGRLGWPSRREIGHGALAERALEPMIPSEDDFPYTIRVVSEILSSNGSTSMASVCGSTLSLMDAGVPLKKPVAGIAMGLVAELDQKKTIKSAVALSDIQGIEDHIGDMDFKVAGTRDGITAIQMDVKIPGVTFAIISKAIEQARQGRLFILEEMQAALPAPRAQLSKYAPKVALIKIAQDQIGEVIGPGGRMIRQIIADTGASIDVDDDGRVTVSGTNEESIRKASDWIRGLTRKVEVGEEFEGTVKRIEPFGAFVEILPGKEGLVHVSRLSSGYVADPKQIVSLGDTLRVIVHEIDNLGRINLSIPGVKKEPHRDWQKRGPRSPHHPHRPRR